MTDAPQAPDHFGVAGGACQKCELPKWCCECLPVVPRVGFMELDARHYHRDPCETPSLSSSIAHKLLNAPAHAHLAHPKFGGKGGKWTRAKGDGTNFHTGMLGVGAPTEVVKLLKKDGSLVTDWTTKAAREQKAEIQARGWIAMLPHESDRMKIIVANCKTNLLTQGVDFYEEGSRRELAVFWEETAANGMTVQCRGLMDHLHQERGRAIDLKSARSAHPRKIQRSIEDFGYDIQYAAYTSGIGHVVPELLGRVDYLLAFCELEEPYICTVVRLTEALKELGRIKWRQAIDIWADCIANDYWPGYVDEIVDIEPTPWALREIEDSVE